MKIIFGLLLFIAAGIASCKKSSYNPGGTETPNASNGWWVNYYIDGNPLFGHPVFFSTYNTSQSKDSMWVDDLHNFWTFKGKVKLDYSNLTFNSGLSQNVYYDDTARISNGKILPRAGHSKTGVATDSIYLEIQFSDETDPGGNPTPYATTFVMSGTARTGFVEDDY